jgi:hypothetical protein
MKRLSVLMFLAFGLAQIHAAVPLTPHNVVVVKCDDVLTSGNTGSLLEYAPGAPGTLVQTIALPGCVFGNSASLVHDMSLSLDHAFVVIPGYDHTATGIESTTAANDNRVIATVKYDGSYARPIVNSALFSGQSPRGATSDGFGNFWATFTSGTRYVTPADQTLATTVVGTGTRACGIFNGHLYRSIAASVDSYSPDLPTGPATASAYISGATSSAGFAIPPGPTTGMKAYICNYNDANGIYAFNYNGSGWDAPYAIKPSNMAGNPQHIAVDYSNPSAPILYFTTVTGSALYRFVDSTGAASTAAADVVATVTSPAFLRGVAMAPTQPAAPVFTQQPFGQSASYGASFSLGAVEATDADPNKWQWKRNTGSGVETLFDGGRYSGTTNKILTISAALASDAGTYWAVASNNGGSTDSDHVVVDLAPSCVTLNSITNAAGTTAVLHAITGTCPGPITGYSWVKDGFTLGDGDTGHGSTISGSATDTLSISTVGDLDAGVYVVTVSAANGPNNAAATLTVVSVPNISQQPQNVDIAAGRTATISVTATGGSLWYNWYKAPSSTSLSDGPTGNGSTYSGAHSAELAISNVRSGDAGTYSVTITNLAGSTPSDPAVLSVGELPVVSLIGDSTNVVGADQTLAATVTAGTPPLTYTWRHNNVVLSDDGHFLNTGTASLGIQTLVATDARLYTLSVSNAYGGVTVSTKLWVATSTEHPNDVADLIIYEPFDYPAGPNPAVSFYSWENIISIYNRITGEPAYWINTGNGLFAGVAPWDANSLYGNSGGGVNRNGGGLPVGVGGGGRFPYPGLDCSTRNYWFFSSSACNNHLHFGGVTNGCAYFSFIFWGDQGSAVINGTYDVVAGFTSGNSDGNGANANNFAYALCTKADTSPGEDNPGSVDGPGGWRFGVFKGGGISISGASVNGQWAPLHCWRAHPYLIVGCYKINSGTNLVSGSITNDDVLSLWVEPPLSSFGADEANLPPPDAGGMTTNWNANAPVTEFAIRATLNTSPFSKRISDVRIGKTWASVTKPHHPTLNLADGPFSATLSWPATDSFGGNWGYGYQLERSDDLVNWTRYLGTDYVLDGQNYTVTVNKPIATQFWRLQYPPRTGAYYNY